MRRFNRFLSINKDKRLFGSWADIVRWDQLKLIYITVPKTANTSIKTALSEAAGIITAEDRVALDADPQRIHQILRTKPGVGISLDDIAKYPDHFVFSTVRDPIDRFVSFYKDKIVGSGWRKEDEAKIFKAYGFSANDSLKDCLKKVARHDDESSEIHFRSQYHVLAPHGHLLPHAIFRFEQLDLMWRVLNGYVADQGFALPAQLEKKNPSRPANVVVDTISEKLIRNRFPDDFKIFGYK